LSAVSKVGPKVASRAASKVCCWVATKVGSKAEMTVA
jgi:hypothetical protein